MARNGMAYTEQEFQWLKGHINNAPWTTIAKQFNEQFPRRKRTANGLANFMASRGVLKEQVCFEKMFAYRTEHFEWLKANRNGNTISTLTEAFNKHFNTSVSKSSIESVMHRLQCKRTDWDGHTKPIGSECIKKGQVYIKITSTGDPHKDWKLKSHLVYEKAYGKIKKGENIIFLDGDATNLNLENLYKANSHISSILKIYNWLFNNQRELQECAIKWCECADYIRTHYNPDFCIKEWSRREKITPLYKTIKGEVIWTSH